MAAGYAPTCPVDKTSNRYASKHQEGARNIKPVLEGEAAAGSEGDDGVRPTLVNSSGQSWSRGFAR